MPTKVTRLRVKGFRKLQEPAEFSLVSPSGEACGQFVFAGPNGCGKTSVLEAILLGLGQDEVLLRDVPGGERRTHWRGRLAPEAEIEVEVSTGAQVLVVRRTASERGGALDLLPGLRVEYFSSWRAPVLVGSLRPLAAGKRPAATEANRLWRLKQRIIDQWVKGLALSRPERTDHILDALNRAWVAFHASDGTRLVPQLVDRDDRETENADADLFLVRASSDRLCSVDQLSSGEIELLSMAGALLLGKAPPDLVVIDEPELHLHPQWQGQVLRALRALVPTAQFIVASHSDDLWDAASSWERALLVPKDDPRSEQWRTAPPAGASPGSPHDVAR